MTDEDLDDLLARCDGRVKVALVVAEKGLSVEESREQLEEAQGVVGDSNGNIGKGVAGPCNL